MFVDTFFLIFCISQLSISQSHRNWMILRDADSGKVIWQENKDFSSTNEEHVAKVPIRILDLRAVSREINFSTIEPMENFRLDQKVCKHTKLLEASILIYFKLGSVQRENIRRMVF